MRCSTAKASYRTLHLLTSAFGTLCESSEAPVAGLQLRCYGASGDELGSIGKLLTERWLHRRRCQLANGAISMRKPKKQQKPLNDLSLSLTSFDPNRTLIGVIELGKESWLVAGIIPGVERQPLKKLEPDENELLKLLERWRAEAEKAGHKINRIAVAFEAGRDEHAASRPTSFMQQALRCRASTGVPRPIGSTLNT